MTVGLGVSCVHTKRLHQVLGQYFTNFGEFVVDFAQVGHLEEIVNHHKQGSNNVV